jgi:aryl-alcohol dehydrogenase-like predicted oxidoreductase
VTRPADASGTFTLRSVPGEDLTVTRLGFGAMRLTGKGIWGAPADHDEAIRVLRRTVELGSTFIDTADSYGPDVSEELIAEALHPYSDDVTIATKGGLLRLGPDEWRPCGRPDYLRQQVEMSLRKLKVERIDLHQLHRIDPTVPVEDSLGAFVELREEGKIRHIGLSEVSVAELRQAQAVTPIASVQNLYNVTNRASQELLDVCTAEGIGFIPWFPLAGGPLAADDGPLAKIAADHGASLSQLALAWLLAKSPVVLPIPGTSKVAHLEDNVAAASVELDAETMAKIEALVSS